MRWLKRGAVILLLAGVLIIGGPWLVVYLMSSDRIFTLREAPMRDVGLVMGAATYKDTPSPYLQGRLDVAVELWRTKRIRAIIVSGNEETNYSEPKAMRKALEKAGVPSEAIIEDPKGFDTYASCVRAKQVYQVDRMTVISQEYHLPRSIAACRLAGVDAVGVGDGTRAKNMVLYRYELRELGANVKLFYDKITNRQVILDSVSDEVKEALRKIN